MKIKEELKLNEIFTKSDLKTGIIIEVRNGTKFMVLLEKGLCIGFTTGLQLRFYNENLIHAIAEELDIIAIYNVSASYHFKDLFITDNLELIWKRDEPNYYKKVPKDFQKAIETIRDYCQFEDCKEHDCSKCQYPLSMIRCGNKVCK